MSTHTTTKTETETETELGLTEDDFERMRAFAEAEGGQRENILVPGRLDADAGDGDLDLSAETRARLRRAANRETYMPVEVCAAMRELARNGETTTSLAHREFVPTDRHDAINDHIFGDCTCEHPIEPLERGFNRNFTLVTREHCEEIRDLLATTELSQVAIGQQVGVSSITVRRHGVVGKDLSCEHDAMTEEGEHPPRFEYSEDDPRIHTSRACHLDQSIN